MSQQKTDFIILEPRKFWEEFGTEQYYRAHWPEKLEWRDDGFLDWVVGLARETSAFYGEKQPAVIDLGCGWGNVLPALRDLGISSYVGLDFSEPMIELARSLHPNGDFRLGSIEEIEAIAPNSYDLCIAHQSLMHFSKRELLEVLMGVRTQMHYGGIMWILTETGDEVEVSPHSCGESIGVEWNLHKPDEWIQIVTEAGFTRIIEKQFPSETQLCLVAQAF